MSYFPDCIQLRCAPSFPLFAAIGHWCWLLPRRPAPPLEPALTIDHTMVCTDEAGAHKRAAWPRFASSREVRPYLSSAFLDHIAPFPTLLSTWREIRRFDRDRPLL